MVMKKKRNIVLLLILVMLVGVFVGCGSSATNPSQSSPGSAPAANPKYVFRFAYDDTEAQSYYIGLLDFKKQLEESSKGAIRVDIYPNAQLGNARDTIEGLKLGTIECAFVSTAALSGFVPEYAIVDAPFIFTGPEQADKVIDGEIGKILREKTLEKQGIRVMGFMDTGYRHVFSTKPVRKLTDFKGLKVRTMDSELHVKTFEALGAIPSPMPAAEIFTALQQRTIDAAENSFSFVVNKKMNEVAKYVIKSGHFYAFCTILISEKVYQKLPADLQKQVLDAADHCIKVQRETVTKQNLDNEKKLKNELGVEIIEIDRESLFKAVEPIYAKYTNLLKPELVQKIKDTK